MKRLILSLAALALATVWACEPDDGTSCVTCTYTQQQETDVVDVCNENGNAVENGYDTQTAYSSYIASLRNIGYTCE